MKRRSKAWENDRRLVEFAVQRSLGPADIQRNTAARWWRISLPSLDRKFDLLQVSDTSFLLLNDEAMDYEQVASDVLPQPVKERIEQAGFRPYLLQATPSVNDALLCATVRRRQVDSGPSQAERPATPVDPFGFDVQSLLCELPELVGDIVGLVSQGTGRESLGGA